MTDYLDTSSVLEQIDLDSLMAGAAALERQEDILKENRKVTPAEAAKFLFEVKEFHKKLDAITKRFYHVMNRTDKTHLPKRMEEYDVDKIRIPSLARSFSVLEKTSASFVDKEAGFKWLRDNGHGDMIQETVNAGTLAAFCRSLLSEEGIEPPSEIIRVNSYNAISITKYSPKGEAR
tara:strand:+ start:6373 stop:6903 length:531 start_codon:yes stop_codon:yes gene_type:complete